jgi:hypothetical protein
MNYVGVQHRCVPRQYPEHRLRGAHLAGGAGGDTAAADSPLVRALRKRVPPP